MSSAAELAAEFNAAAKQMHTEARNIVTTYSDLGVSKAKALASSFTHISRVSARTGRAYFPDPHVGGYVGEGPNVRTGDYRRTIGPAEVTDLGDGVFVGRFGTNAPQGAKLEFGYTAANGRSVKALPHLIPAAEWAAAQIEAALDRLVAGL